MAKYYDVSFKLTKPQIKALANWLEDASDRIDFNDHYDLRNTVSSYDALLQAVKDAAAKSRKA